MTDAPESDAGNLVKPIDHCHERVKVSINDVELTNIHELKIIRAINQHVLLNCSGVISGEDHQQRNKVESFDASASIVVRVQKFNQESAVTTGCSESQAANSQGQIVFQGRIRQIETFLQNDVYTVEFCGVSYTDELDVIVGSQSFQDIGQSYQAVVQQTLQPFAKAHFVNKAESEAAIGKLIIRYQERAWAFLTRLASLLNTGLVADAIAAYPQFWFGIPCQNEWTVQMDCYTVRNYCETAGTKDDIRGETSGVPGFCYEVNGLQQLFQLGDQVKFNGQTLYVAQAVSRMTDSIMWHDYILTTQAGLKQPVLQNDSIVGVSLDGIVIAVENDTVKVRLEIDETQDETTAWNFRYATPYSAEGDPGWFCMPESGDAVKVKFPNQAESSGYVTSSVRQKVENVPADKITDPDHRYLRTPQGCELLFDPKGIAFSTEKDPKNANGFNLKIRVDQDQGIVISSDQDIALYAKTALTLQAGQIRLNAGKEVTLACKESKLTFASSRVQIEGTTIHRANGESYIK